MGSGNLGNLGNLGNGDGKWEEGLVRRLCDDLLEADPQIRDVVQFGSSVYAPDSARDIDLIVTTRLKRDYGVYLDRVADSVAGASKPVHVDLIVREPGEKIGRNIAAGLVASSVILYGRGETLEEVSTVMALPTYEVAKKLLVRADGMLADADIEQDAILKEDKYRDTFNKLFDAARNAVMAYLNVEQTRWSQLRRLLPDSFQQRFREIIDTLHISYGYHGAYPRDRVDEEFQRWRATVSRFIDDLEEASPV